MLTSRYPHEVDSEDLHTPLPAGITILPSWLSESGYFTGSLLKQHVGPHAAAQFDWSRDALDVDEFLAAAGDRPFFLWIGFREPHRPYGNAPERHDPARAPLPPTFVDDQPTRADVARYFDEIAVLDDKVGEVLAALQKDGREESTYVFFLSDNGAPLPRQKATLYDLGIRTPLIATGPGIEPGSRYAGLLSAIDLAPTIAALANARLPAVTRGRSFAEALLGSAEPVRDVVFSQRDWHNADEHMRSVRDARYKLIFNHYTELPHGSPSDITVSGAWQALREARDDGRLSDAQRLLFAVPRPRIEFFDLQTDPFELNNLAHDPAHRDRIVSMMQRLDTWREETGDVPATERRRDDNVDRMTGVKFTRRIPPRIE